MPRIKKYLLLLTAIFLLLFIGSAIALRIAFPPEKIKQLALIEISNRMGREVSFGSVSLNIFAGISLENFKCSEKPDFKSGSFIECRKFSLGLSLLPLLQKQLNIDSIKLVSPKINVIRKNDGITYNFSDLVQQSTVPAKSSTTQSHSVHVQVTKVKVTDGTFSFRDQSPQNLSGTVQNLNCSIQGGSVQRPMKTELSAKIDMEQSFSGLPIRGELKFLGIINLPQQQIKVDQLQWETQNLYKLNLKGLVENFTKPKIDIEFDGSKIILDQIAKKYTPSISGTAQTKLKIKGEFDLNKIKGLGVRIGHFDFDFYTDLSDTDLIYKIHYKKNKGDKLNIKLSGIWDSKGPQNEIIELTQGMINYKDMSIESSGKIHSGLNPQYQLNLKVANLTLFEISNLLKDFHVPANLMAGKIDLNSSVSGNNNEIDISELKLLYGKSQIEMRGKIFDLKTNQQKFDLTLKTAQFELDKLLEPALLPEGLSINGTSAFNIGLSGTKENIKAVIDADFKEAGIAYKQIFAKNQGIPLVISLKCNELSKQNIDLDAYSLLIGGAKIHGTMKVLGYHAPKKTFDVSILLDSPYEIKDTIALFPSITGIESGTIQSNLYISGSIPFTTLPRITGTAVINDIHSNFNGLNVKDLKGKLIFSENRYDLPDLSGKVSETPFSLNASINNPSHPSITLDAKLQTVDMTSWKSNVKPKEKIEGTIKSGESAATDSGLVWQFPIERFQGQVSIKEFNHKNFEAGNITFNTEMNHITPKLNQISGSARLRTFGGQAKNIGGTAEKILKIVNPSLSILDFQDIGGDFVIKEGNILIQDLWVESDQLQIGSEGSISLPNKTCDINLLARYSGTALSASVPIRITGPLSSPKVEKTGISILSQTFQEKLLRRKPKTSEELREEKARKEEKIQEGKEEQLMKETEKKEKEEEKIISAQEKTAEKEELKKQAEEEKREKRTEKEDLKKEKEEEMLERLKEKEEERLGKLKEKEERKRQKEEDGE